MAAFSAMLRSVVAMGLVAHVGASGAIGSRGQHVSDVALQSGLENLHMLEQLGENAMQGDKLMTTLRVSRNLEDARSLYDSAPKNTNGDLSTNNVQAVLLNLFTQRGGKVAPKAVEEQQLVGKSFDLYQTAMLATMLESELWLQQAGNDVAESEDEMKSIVRDHIDEVTTVETIESWNLTSSGLMLFAFSVFAFLLRTFGSKFVSYGKSRFE